MEQEDIFIKTIQMMNDGAILSTGQLQGVLNTSNSYQRHHQSKVFIGGKGKLEETNKRLFARQDHHQPVGAINDQRPLIEPLIERLINRDSSFEADDRVCKLLLSGVVAIFGPSNGKSIQHVQSICDTLEIPHIEMHADFAPKRQDLTVNLYPPAQLLTAAYIELFNAWNWTSFAIVYEDSDSMIRLQSLFRESSGTWTSKWSIRLFQYSPTLSSLSVKKNAASSIITKQRTIQQIQADDETVLAEEDTASGSFYNDINLAATTDKLLNTMNNNSEDEKIRLGHVKKKEKTASFRELFWKLKLSGETNVLLDVKDENLYTALKHAQQVGCMTEKYSYLIASLDLHMIDLEDFKYSKTLITSFRLVRDLDFDFENKNKNLDLNPIMNENKNNFGVAKQFDEAYLRSLGLWPSTSSPIETTNDSPWGQRQNEGSSLSQAEANGYLEAAHAYDDITSKSINKHGVNSNDENGPAKRALDLYLLEQRDKLNRNPRLRLSTKSALIHDALLLLMMGLNDLDTGQSIGVQPISCSKDGEPWSYGSSIVNYMRRITFSGLSGLVSFDERGLRTGFTLDLMSVAPSIGLVKIGQWNSEAYTRSLRGGNMNWQFNKSPTSTNLFEQQQSQPTRKNSNVQDHHYYNLSTDSSSSSAVQATTNSSMMMAPKVFKGELNDDKRSPVITTPTMAKSAPTVQQSEVSSKLFVAKFDKSKSSSKALMVNEELFQRIYLDSSDDMETLIVTTRRTQPYFMLKETPNKQEGNNQYEGFAVDLIHELSKLVGFKYRFKEVDDGKYGAKIKHKNGTQSWNGMIGEIISGKADLAIVDLTITSQREEAVDFTLPFMNTGISILFKKPTTKQNTLFSFLSPFSSDVWAYVVAAYASISTLLFFVGRISPYEWANPHPCRQDLHESNEIVMRNNFSLMNSFWFTTGSLMQQGSDLTPRSMSTRTIAGIWYFFTLIMISSYTANLAAFLTVEKVVYPIENAKDLSVQQEIRYGCVESGSTCTFFSDSHIDTYKRIGQTMEKYKTYVKSNDEGQERVEEGKFAFFMESTSIEYITERNCNLTQIGGLLDSKGYGVATSKKPTRKRPYRTLLSEGILHLQENGVLHILKNRWWKERRGGGTCTDDAKGGVVTELSLGNVGGVFVVLLGGLGLSFLFAIAEFMWKSRKISANRDSMCEEMIKDLKFALSCQSSTKPAVKKPSAPMKRCCSSLQQQEPTNKQHCDPLGRKHMRPTSNGYDHLNNYHNLLRALQQQYSTFESDTELATVTRE